MKLSQVEWVTVSKAVAKEYNKDDVPGLAAEMAYHFMFTLFPFAIFLAALTGLVGQAIGEDQLFDQIMNTLYSGLPEETANALRTPLNEVLRQQRGGALTAGVALALWSASNGVATVMKAFNRAYGVEETRGFIKRKALSIGLTLLLSLLLIVGFVSILFGGQIGEWIAGQFGLGTAFGVVWAVVRVALALLGFSFALAILYWKGPNVDQQFQWISPGSAITTLTWVAATAAFGLYVRFMGASSYSKTYGTAFGFILFLLYLYLASIVVLLGAEFNAETTKRYDPEAIRDKITDPRKQLPGEQPAPHPQAAAEAGVSPQEVTETNERSAAKIAAGGGSPATATAGARAGGDGTAAEGAAGGRRDGAATDGPPRPPATDGAPAETGRNRLATFAVSGAALAGAVVLGLLHGRDGRDRR